MIRTIQDFPSGSGSSNTGPTMSSKPDFQTWLSTLPLQTRLVGMFLILIHLLTFFFPYTASNLALDPTKVTQIGEFYLIITGPLLHGSVGHLTLNTLALASEGTTLETKLGTALFTVMLITLHILSAMVYVIISFLYTTLTDIPSNPVVGYSGVLFALAVVDAHIIHVANTSYDTNTTSTPRGLAGHMLNMPRVLRPWAIILFVQIMFPREASFWGHVAGAASGYMVTVYGDVLLPHRDALMRFDGLLLGVAGWLTSRWGYQPTQSAFTDATNPFRVRSTETPWGAFIMWIRHAFARISASNNNNNTIPSSSSAV